MLGESSFELFALDVSVFKFSDFNVSVSKFSVTRLKNMKRVVAAIVSAALIITAQPQTATTTLAAQVSDNENILDEAAFFEFPASELSTFDVSAFKSPAFELFALDVSVFKSRVQRQRIQKH